MSSTGSQSAPTSTTTPSIPETMNTTTTTPEPSIRNSQDKDNESLETIESLQQRNKWSEDQMTRIGKKINQQSRELAEKDQVISSLRTAIGGEVGGAQQHEGKHGGFERGAQKGEV
jgi:hypothetical protein